MVNFAESSDGIGGWLLKRRWLVMTLVSLLIIAMEVAEHQPHRLQFADPQFWREILIFGLALPFGSAIMLSLLSRANIEARRALLGDDNADTEELVETIRTVTAEAERRRIARQLHDTVGQDIAYLHFRLDQLTGDGTLGGHIAGHELEQVRALASTAYERVRATLISLRAANSMELAAALLDQAQQFGGRSGFKVRMISRGEPRPLLPEVQNQLLYIFQEALVNIEQHAGATWVDIRLIWTHNTLEIRLLDNGRGFNPQTLTSPPDQPSSSGLGIMRELAEELGGRFTLHSELGKGTEVALHLPLHLLTTHQN